MTENRKIRIQMTLSGDLVFTADVDTLQSLYKGRGRKGSGSHCAEFRMGLQTMRDLAKKYGFRWTLFVTGDDLCFDENLNSIKKILSDGHEIACHTMTHPQGFRFLSPGEKDRELKEFDRMVRDRLGVKSVGFRSPGWNISDDMTGLLKQNGYRYDASVFPTWIAPGLKFLHWIKTRACAKRDRTTLGHWFYALAPSGPYRTQPDHLSRRGDGAIWEYPMTVTPCLRLPFYATYHLTLGYRSFERGLQSLLQAKRRYIQYTFHLSDFVDYSDPIFSGQLPAGGEGFYVSKTFRVPLSEKMALWEKIFSSLLKLKYRNPRFCDLVSE